MCSLKELCLDNIIANFNAYNLAYATTKDATLKLKLEFLRKEYSFQIGSRLHEEYNFKTEYIDFLINKYLKTLNTYWLDACSWDVITKKLSEIGSSFEDGIFNGYERPWEQIICYLTNLKSVLYQRCNNQALHAIAKFCPKIESIHAENSPEISDDGIKHLCYNEGSKILCPALKELEIASTNVSDDGIKYVIKNLPSLAKIDYANLPYVLYSIHKDDINDLGNVKPYNITNLNLNNINTTPIIGDVLKVCTSVCPHLESLGYPVYIQEHLDFCSQLCKLKELQLDCYTEHPLAINDILKLKGSKLLSLKLRNFTVSTSTLFRSCPQLSSLELHKVTFECNSNEFVPVLHNLKKISLEKLNMMDATTNKAVIHLLSSSPHLKHLSFAYCKMFSANAKTQILKFCEQYKLEHIDFSYSDVEIDFVRDVLLTCSSLQVLILEGCEITQEYTRIEDLEAIALNLPNAPCLVYTDDDEFPNEFANDDFYGFDGDYDDDDDCCEDYDDDCCEDYDDD